MPGLSQLKQFNSDILSLGDEITVRASRGESPVKLPIPKEVKDENDSEEFVLGMPENEAPEPVIDAEEDLSDLVGLGSSSSKNDTQSEATPGFEAPDLSSLLNPINVPDDSFAGTDMPDLSMFDEVEEQEEEIVEEEPEEVSVADLGLDALLAGAGFDAPEEEPEEEEEESEPLNINDFEEVDSLDSLMDEPEALAEVPEALEEPESLGEPLEDFASGLDEPLSDSPIDIDSPADSNAFSGGVSDLDFDPSVLDLDTNTDAASDSSESSDGLGDLGELGDFGDLGELGEGADFDEPAELGDGADFGEGVELGEASDLGDLGDLGEAAELGDGADFAEPAELGDEADLTDPADLGDTSGLDDLSDLGDFDLPETASDESDLTPSADLDSLENIELNDPDDLDLPVEDEPSVEEASDSMEAPLGEDFSTEGLDDSFDSAPDGLFDSADMELPEDIEAPAADEGTPSDEGMGEGLTGLEGLGDLGDLGDLDSIGSSTPEADSDLGSADFSGDIFSSTDTPAENPFDTTEDAVDSIGDTEDFGDTAGMDDFDAAGIETAESEDFGEDSVPLEDFDTTDMEGLDFGIPDTDTQLNSDFELGNNDEFAMEGDFEIPGFSDVDTAKDEKSSTPLVSGKTKEKKPRRGKKGNQEIDQADFSGALESEDLPPNTLSDEQYKVFLKNFNEYPLNVRLAFEDFIVQDEFTDDAEFEIVEKILNKAPARQVASMLEKMLDISIPVPRDFEHRTAEEYEAYKKSLSYQLKNKIIPGLLVGVVCIFVGMGIFQFGKNCIYKPLRANHFYKQGYVLLQQDEYPQSEINFERAIQYRYNKGWFFKYARGYREHKQYQRAAKMYQNILICFKHDKVAGLEYADMELNDLANYERAEEIVKRDILDYHINDSDGILMLGDVYLEWGTEKNPAKFDLAREQYATLIQLYGDNDLYESRMMRYFIRTDNLRQVIGLQKRFEPKEKSLSGEDWTELSGYLLDKSYGVLSPADEYLRFQIEGLRKLLLRAVKQSPANPIALYNLSRYYVQTNEAGAVEPALIKTIDTFNNATSLKNRDIYKYIDSYRLLGEHYISTNDYLKAQQQLADGITLYTTERDNAGFRGTPKIGKLYEDLANLKYFVAGDYDEALQNYTASIELENDNPSMRYKIGYIQYKKSNYAEALGSFMKAGDGNIKEKNLMQAMANTLSLRGDDYAAQGYYEQLLEKLDNEIAEKGVVFPQANATEHDLVNTYLTASNNYGVTLYRLAKRTGNSSLNAQSIVQFSQSVRAWDALTRNQQTMVRLGGSNLAEQNIKYITNRVPDFEPAIYIDIKKTMTDKERF